MPDRSVKLVARHLGGLFQTRLEMAARVGFHADAPTIARHLREGELDLGIVYGYELAWLSEHVTDLKPLVITVPTCQRYQGALVVRAQDGLKGWEDLRGKTIALAPRSRGHCRLFLERQGPADAKIIEPQRVQDALDDVVDGLADATVVEAEAFAGFARLKPGRADKLTILTTSEIFPAAAMIYRDGALSEETRDALTRKILQVGENPLERRIMALFRLDRFATVPEDYTEQLINIRKSYCCPSDWQQTMKESATGGE